MFSSYAAICEYCSQHLSSQHVSTETAAVRQNITFDFRYTFRIVFWCHI